MVTSEDKLVVAAKRYHQARERLRQTPRTSWAAAMARESLQEDLEQAARELHEAADAYGVSHP